MWLAVGEVFFFGEGLFFENGLKDLFELTQKYCHFRKAKETGTMFGRITLYPEG
jgi:hypothetical protein